MLRSMDILCEDLAPEGAAKIDWAQRAMPVLASIRERFARDRPLAGKAIAACLHVTAETAVLMRTLQAGGADVRLCASNPLSTQDDVAAALAVGDGIEVFAIGGEDRETYFAHLDETIAHRPQILMDDGADLAMLAHTKAKDLEVLGGTEETTTGVTRLRSMARESVLRYPVIAVNDSKTKHMFDNRYGTGQSTIDGFLRATNRLIAGATFVVAGYGWCGRGLATRAAGMGARVIVTEVDPVRALEAAMDGFDVKPMAEAVRVADFLCTATGNELVVSREHFAVMKDGAVVANAGHFDVELDVQSLAEMASGSAQIRPTLRQYTLDDGRHIHLLAQGRLVNLAAAEGHPADVMDLSFANQALAAEYLVREGAGLPCAVSPLPETLDRNIAQLKLDALGVGIDTLTDAQQRYLGGWRVGT